MLCVQMPSLMPALQQLSVSPWQRATSVIGPWRSSCTPVVRDEAHSGPALICLGMAWKQFAMTVQDAKQDRPSHLRECWSRLKIEGLGLWDYLTELCLFFSEPHQPHLMLEAGSLSSAEYEAQVRARHDFQRLQQRASDGERQVWLSV